MKGSGGKSGQALFLMTYLSSVILLVFILVKNVYAPQIDLF